MRKNSKRRLEEVVKHDIVEHTEDLGTVRCHSCNEEVPSSMFCLSCGAPLTEYAVKITVMFENEKEEKKNVQRSNKRTKISNSA